MSDARTSATGWHVARITFEAESPLSCGAGEGDRADNAIARDASGLPYVPGPTLQGLLRAFYSGCTDEREILFGPDAGSSTHRAAALAVSHAHVHGSSNTAVAFPADTKGDELLKFLAQDAPLVRDHVRLDHRHGAADAGKFDRAAVPAGTRFSFELLINGTEDDGKKLDSVISAMIQPDFRIGSSGARGYGKVGTVSAQRGFFTSVNFEAFRKLRGSPLSDNPDNCLGESCALNAVPTCLIISFDLSPLNPWRSGQGRVPGAPDKDGKTADLRPLREGQIIWEKDNGRWQPPKHNEANRYVLPGSSVRGPLAHRSLYWWNRHSGHLLLDDSTADCLEALLANHDCLKGLFGKVDCDGGLVSPLLVDDVEVKVSNVLRHTHVKIAANTGGSSRSALYDEEVIGGDALSCRLYVRQPRSKDQAVGNGQRKAFLSALHDLLNGRLALGAKSYGFCGSSGEPKFEHVGNSDWQVCWSGIVADAAKQANNMATDAGSGSMQEARHGEQV